MCKFNLLEFEKLQWRVDCQKAIFYASTFVKLQSGNFLLAILLHCSIFLVYILTIGAILNAMHMHDDIATSFTGARPNICNPNMTNNQSDGLIGINIIII